MTLTKRDCGHYASGSMSAGIGEVSSSAAALKNGGTGHLLEQIVPHVPELSILKLTTVLATSGQRLVMQPFLQLMYPSRHELRQLLSNFEFVSERIHLHLLELRIADKKVMHLHFL